MKVSLTKSISGPVRDTCHSRALRRGTRVALDASHNRPRNDLSKERSLAKAFPTQNKQSSLLGTCRIIRQLSPVLRSPTGRSNKSYRVHASQTVEEGEGSEAEGYVWPEWQRIAGSMGAGLVGGCIFSAVNIPLPWMLGSMFGNMVACILGAPVKVPEKLRFTMQTVIGVLLGSSFTPELLASMAGYLGSIVGLLTYSFLGFVVIAYFLRKFRDYDLPTAVFSAAPGGLNDMTIIGTEMGGDQRVIAISHSIRLFTVVTSLPFLFKTFASSEAFVQSATAAPTVLALPGSMPWAAWLLHLLGNMSPADAAVLVLCGALGPAFGKAARVPASFLVGPMLLSTAAHLGGLTMARPPFVFVLIAQVVLGSALGAGFAGTKFAEVRKVAQTAIGSTIFLISLATLFARALQPVLGAPWPLLLLSFSPGGITEMTLLSLALGYDSAFVVAHHMTRISLVLLLVPIFYQSISKPSQDDKSDKGADPKAA